MGMWLAVVGLVWAGTVAAQAPDELRKMMDSNQAFALRDAVEHEGTGASVFYRGAVEAAENEIVTARKDLQQVIRDGPRSKEASSARELLANMESRNGHYRDALRWVEDAVAKTNSGDAKNALPAFRAFAEAGDMKVVRSNSSSVDCTDGLRVIINGKMVTYGGNDILDQAKTVVLDFDAMELRLE